LCAYQAVNLNLLEEYILAVEELAFLLQLVSFLGLTLLNLPCLQVVCVSRMICATFNLMSLLLENQTARNSDFDRFVWPWVRRLSDSRSRVGREALALRSIMILSKGTRRHY